MIRPEGAAAAAGAGAATMPVTFSFESFNPAAGKFNRWLDRLQISFRIYKVADVNKRDYLLYFMGGAAYEILCNKLMDEPPLEKSCDQIVTILKNHFTPAPLEILENFKFQSCKQLEHETLSDYLMDLEKLAQTCNFEAHLNKAIRNQFVFGIRIRVIQSRLLEVRDLTLERAKEVAFGMEMSFRGTDEMHGFRLRPSAEVKYIEHGKTKKKKSNNQQSSTNSTAAASSKKFDGQKRTGYRCGDDGHLADKCIYVTTKCKFCNKKGHLEKVYQSKRKEKMRKDDEHHP
ncbi:uncharacterized protein LOC129737644 [Uranotaenia lowii]|uniref:uncharacterized protein LOC129737644 n=1 Tax=Uranotaenia lowii TaxID=190385 RepID=UPI0024792609|nr:uncharacterized protein LOC129737644 [Uranotaenia lowii]